MGCICFIFHGFRFATHGYYNITPSGCNIKGIIFVQPLPERSDLRGFGDVPSPSPAGAAGWAGEIWGFVDVSYPWVRYAQAGAIHSATPLIIAKEQLLDLCK